MAEIFIIWSSKKINDTQISAYINHANLIWLFFQNIQEKNKCNK